MIPELKVSGLGELEADFLQLSKAMQGKGTRDAAMAGARVARDLIKKNAPVRSGRMKRNIVVRRARQSETPGSAVAGVAVRGINPAGTNSDRSMKKDDPKNAYYWRFVEQGTVHQQANPFVRRSWDGGLDQVEAATKNRLAEAIDKARAR